MSLEQGDLSSLPVEWDKQEYWDSKALYREMRRQYDVCNSCRLCFNLCPGFPKLFEHFDDEHVDSDPQKLPPTSSSNSSTSVTTVNYVSLSVLILLLINSSSTFRSWSCAHA